MGYGIIAIHKIKNEKTEQKCVIGSECISGFDNVDPINELWKKRNEKALRDGMKDFRTDVFDKIWNDKKFAVKNQRTKTGKQKPLPIFFKFWKDHKDLNIDTCELQEIRKILIYAEEKLPFVRLSESLEDLLHPKKANEKARSKARGKKTGLDEFL